jgi:hypothetical protein
MDIMEFIGLETGRSFLCKSCSIPMIHRQVGFCGTHIPGQDIELAPGCKLMDV